MHKRCGGTRRGDGQIARAERINLVGQIGVRLGVFFTRHGSAVNNDFGAIGVGMLHDRGEIGNVDFDVGWNDSVARMVGLCSMRDLIAACAGDPYDRLGSMNMGILPEDLETTKVYDTFALKRRWQFSVRYAGMPQSHRITNQLFASFRYRAHRHLPNFPKGHPFLVHPECNNAW